MKMERILQSISLLFLFTTLAFLALYISQSSSKSTEVVYPKDLVKVEFTGRVIGSYLWIDRSQDVVIQAFVLFASALGALLFFKAEG